MAILLSVSLSSPDAYPFRSQKSIGFSMSKNIKKFQKCMSIPENGFKTKENKMEREREQPWTFREFYDKLLNPSPAFDNRGRHEKCYKDWCAMDEAERQGICKIIEEAQSNGDYIDPNPCFAMNNAMQEYEKRLAKAQAVKKKDPMNYNGSSKYLKEVKKTPLVSAPYKGVFGIYSLAEAQEFHLEIKRAINFNLREYMEQKAINPEYQPPIINRD